MKKRLFHVLIISLLAVFASTAYFKASTLPASVKDFVVGEIERATGKKLFIDSIRFSVLKGLVLERPVLYDKTSVIIRAREISCGFVYPSLFRRRIVIPVIRIESPLVFVERRADNSFNISELIPKDYSPKGGVASMFHRIIVRRGTIDFVDRTQSPAFRRKFEDASLDVRLYLPVRIAFAFRSVSGPALQTSVSLTGEYVIPSGEAASRLAAKSVVPAEFAQYYAASGFSLPEGAIDATGVISFKEGAVDAEIDADAEALAILKGAMRAKLDAGMKVLIRYDVADKTIEYAGKMNIRNMDITGIEGIGKLQKIKADVEFNDTRLFSENMTAETFGMNWKAKANLVNYAKPILDIYADTQVHLGALQKTLRDEFKIDLPTEMSGNADVRVAIGVEPDKPMKISGSLDVRDATVSMGSGNFPLERLNGKAQFTPDSMKWSDVSFSYRGTSYKTSGELADFASPAVNLSVRSQDLSFKSVLALAGKKINLSEMRGQYLNSPFSGTGELDLSDPTALDANLTGAADVNLADLKLVLKDSAGVRKMKPAGILHADFSLSGDLKDPKGCFIDARFKSGRMSLYGLRLTEAVLDYVQEEGQGRVRSMRASLYGGTVATVAKIDWLSKGFPYSANLDVRDVKIQKLKTDTNFKDKDVSGDIRVTANLTGVFKDISRVAGIGHIAITNGKLWQLNLFKGLGSMVFTSDFSDIVFTDGFCDFKVRNRTIFADYFVMKSELVNMYGSGKIGFDRSVEGTLKTELTEEAMSPGTQRNIAAAVGRYSEIEISGTLSDPKYKMKQNVPGIALGIAGAFLQGSQE